MAHAYPSGTPSPRPVTHRLASGTSVGVVGTVKIIPQWLLAFTMDGASIDPRHLIGVCLVTLSACAWAASGGVSKSPPRLPSRVLFV